INDYPYPKNEPHILYAVYYVILKLWNHNHDNLLYRSSLMIFRTVMLKVGQYVNLCDKWLESLGFRLPWCPGR
ncbi:hypothetical protein L9F63_023842, partial [Diploptera punctata]